MEALDEIVAEFLAESRENLDQLDRDLVALERDPTSAPLLGSIFRTIHTIKGTTGFLAFGHLEALTHAGESLLSRLRDGELELTAEITDALLTMVDAVRALLAAIEATGQEGEPDHSALIATLTRLQRGEGGAPAAAEAATEAAAEQPREAPPAERRAGTDTVRVDVERLDSLMRLMGELVLARNQIVTHADVSQDDALTRASTRLSLITSELQEVVLKTRMQPIDNLWSKLPRILRDLSATCGKSVRLRLEGRETELDKTILEAVKDPLTHLVRNAVDHGIESPQARLASGKDEQGVLLLRAFHEGGQVHIEIRDDGAGMDPGRIAAKALERGLVSAERLAQMSEREVVQTIFLPGFSTATTVTSVSGRGVGLDVVKANLEKIGGTIDVDSDLGAGTTFRIKIPLTLAIVPALTVRCAGDRYAIPTLNLVQLVRLEGGEAGRGGIELVSEAPVYRLRGKLLPLVYLSRELGIPEPERGGGETLFIVVLQVEGQQFGLLVDEVLDTREIVVKPLSAQLKGVGVYAGTTILGDGSVALILDVLALARGARVLSGDRELARGAAVVGDGGRPRPRDELLVASVGNGRRVGIPLAAVTRLEEIPAASIEHTGTRELVQYRDQILPLIRLAPLLAGAAAPVDDELLAVVVCSARGRSVGLVVDAILDIVEDDRPGGRDDLDGAGLGGPIVIQDRITELLDVERAVRAADPRLLEAAATSAGGRA